MPEVIVYIDEDDVISTPIADELGIKHVHGPRKLLSLCYNDAASVATNDLIMYAGDDLVWQTKDWDAKVVNVFDKVPDKILVAHGNDMSHGHTQHATHGILHKRWIDGVGYFAPPYFAGWFDSWITDLGNRLSRRIFVDFVHEHMHFTHGKAKMDATYDEAKARQDQDVKNFTLLEAQRIADAGRLRQLIGTTGKVEPVTTPSGCCINCKARCVVVTNAHNRCNQCGTEW